MNKNANFNQLLNNSIATYDKLLQPNVKCITSPFQGHRINVCVLSNKMEIVYVPALVNECTICCTYKDWLNDTSEGSSSLM